MTISGKKYVECTMLGSGSGAEADDSSYDSDYEPENSSQTEDQLSTVRHSDVSRTTSDTLAAEFAEYVTVHGPLQSIGALLTPHNPGYTARVEFALKLGYTERLVQAALQKLGPDPGQNELLAELIKLGAANATGPKLADTPDETEALLPESEGQLVPNCHFVGQECGPSATSCCVSPTTSPSIVDPSCGLRSVVIDGSNVAMSHGNKEVFSCRGIKICVEWFRARGHREITVFVPKWRKEASRPDNPVVDQEILGELERDRLLVFTPSRLVGGKRLVCYDDRYILRLAAELDGIVVSNDNYRDLAQESPEFRKVIEERILMYSFVNDRFMPPDDPLGRTGPTLDNFLRFRPRRTRVAPPCPYAKKCTYGNKCKYRHPERGPHPHKSVTERLVEQAQRYFQARSPNLALAISSAVTATSTPIITSTTMTTTSTTSTTSTTAVVPSSPSPSLLSRPSQQHSSLVKTKSWAAGHSSSNNSLPFSVLKSKSVENVTLESTTAYAHTAPSTLTTSAYSTSFGWVTSKIVNSDPEPANMHRKLQRQLTLNPTSDPRINQLRRYHRQPQLPILLKQQRSQSPRSSQSIVSSTYSTMQNRQLPKYINNDNSYSISMSWEHQQRHHSHQHATRIASAPDSYRAQLPIKTSNDSNNVNLINSNSTAILSRSSIQRLGNSDSQLNLLHSQTSNFRISSWEIQRQHHQDTRRRLHYHLANIFPEEQVQTAMALNPHETDPQQICAAILSMFPKL